MSNTLERGRVSKASPLQVTIGASTTAVPAARLTSYTPAKNDAVAVLLFADNGQPLVLGPYA